MKLHQRTIQLLLLVLTATLAGCSSMGVQVPQSPLLGAITRSGRIVYIGLDRNVYTIDQNGDNQIAITTDALLPSEATPGENWQVYTHSAWGPDNSLAYVAMGGIAGTNQQSSGEIYVNNNQGTAHRRIFSSETLFPSYLYWSPNGEKVGFLSLIGNSGLLAIQVADVDGDDGEGHVLDTGSPVFWAWSPASDYLLAHVGARGPEDRSSRLTMLTADAPVVEAGLMAPPARFQAPEFSPDGQYVLYAVRSGDDDDGRLVLSPADDVSEMTTLMRFSGGISFSWSPDGRHVAAIANDRLDDGSFRNRLVFLDMADPENPIETEVEGEGMIAFFWSPDSSQVAYFVGHVETFLIENENGEAVQQQVELMELRVAEAETGDSRSLVERFQITDVFFASVLLYADQYQRSATIWSPDGNNIVLPVLTGQGPYIATVPIEGGIEPIAIVEGYLAFWSPGEIEE